MEPAAAPAIELVLEPAVEPVAVPAEQPVAQPVVEQPVVQPVVEPVVQPAQPAQPVAQPQQPFEQQSYSATAGAAPGVPVAAPMGYQPPVAQQAQGGTGALVCGILTIVFAFIMPFIAIILGIVAIVLASKAAGAGKAKTGRICGIVGIVISAVMLALTLVLGIAVYDELSSNDYSSGGSSSSVSEIIGSSGAHSDLSANQQEAENLVTYRFDALANADAAVVAEIAAIVEDGFYEAFEIELADCGVDAEDYARAMLDGLEYEVSTVVVDEAEGTGWVGVDVTYRDIFGVLANFETAITELDDSGEAAGMTESEAMNRIGQLFMESVENAPVEEDANYAIIDLVYENGEWVIDEDSWDFEMDYMFNVI